MLARLLEASPSTECRWNGRCLAALADLQASANGCVFVSNDHGDALEEWLRATADAERPLAVFHVDAHNDLNVPEGREPFTSPASSDELRRRLQQNSTLLHQFTAGVDLANFQLAAVRAGVVDRIVWVRQSVPSDDMRALHSVHSTASTAASEHCTRARALHSEHCSEHCSQQALPIEHCSQRALQQAHSTASTAASEHCNKHTVQPTSRARNGSNGSAFAQNYVLPDPGPCRASSPRAHDRRHRV